MRRFWSLPIEWFVLLIPIVLTITGIITIYTITFHQYGNRLAIDQGVFALVAILAMVVMMSIDYRALRSFNVLLFVIGILLLVPLLPFLAPSLPFVLKVFGAYRWLDFGFFQLQPSEVFKLIGAVTGSAFLAQHIGVMGWRRIVGFLLIAALPVGLVMLQPDLGTASVLLIVFLSIFLAAKPSRRMLALLAGIIVVALPILFFNLQPYQRQRVETFLNPMSDPLGEGYNVRQSLIAVGSGGLFGRGFGQGSQTVLNFLPVAHADFIFAGFAEATGFVGSVLAVSLYTLLIFRILAVAREADDPFAQLLCIGIAAKFFFQGFVHISMNIGLLPVTGIPLPFMSYGGTALIVDFAAIGIVESIAIRHKKILFH
jgi:rod shape determining protein RodA